MNSISLHAVNSAKSNNRIGISNNQSIPTTTVSGGRTQDLKQVFIVDIKAFQEVVSDCRLNRFTRMARVESGRVQRELENQN